MPICSPREQHGVNVVSSGWERRRSHRDQFSHLRKWSFGFSWACCFLGSLGTALDLSQLLPCSHPCRTLTLVFLSLLRGSAQSSRFCPRSGRELCIPCCTHPSAPAQPSHTLILNTFLFHCWLKIPPPILPFISSSFPFPNFTAAASQTCLAKQLFLLHISLFQKARG